MQEPIFFLWTRSFWLSVLGVGALLAQDAAALKAAIELLAMVTPFEAAEITPWVQRVTPVVLFLAALQQRSGAARPYTVNPKARK